MFMELFLKECKQILKCTTFYLIVICMILFINSQMEAFKMLEKPKPGQESYGTTYSKDETVIMNNTVRLFVLEYAQNNYSTYPVGFNKTVILNKEKQVIMSRIAAEVTGMTAEELISTVDEYLNDVTPTSDQISMTVSPDMTYARFKELMKQADKLLGGGSHYSSAYILSNASVPMTYEEALAEYNEIIKKDHLSGAYARLLCDYMGIVLAILPVFLAVTRGVRDKRARASQVIFSRKASSFHIILSRYLSMIIMILIPTLLIGVLLTVQCIYNGKSAGVTVDYFAFIKYTLGWLLPTIMISTSVGVLLTELTESAIAIVIQGIWWFISIFMGMTKMMGGYGWNLIPRHNTLGNYQIFKDNFGLLAANRITYATAAILLVAAAVVVYDRKRKGKLIIHGKIFSNRKSKSEV